MCLFQMYYIPALILLFLFIKCLLRVVATGRWWQSGGRNEAVKRMKPHRQNSRHPQTPTIHHYSQPILAPSRYISSTWLQQATSSAGIRKEVIGLPTKSVQSLEWKQAVLLNSRICLSFDKHKRRMQLVLHHASAAFQEYSWSWLWIVVRCISKNALVLG
jgi:hypothetical protein